MIIMLHILYTATAAAAQEGPGIVIRRTGQDVELLCSLNMTNLSSIPLCCLGLG